MAAIDSSTNSNESAANVRPPPLNQSDAITSLLSLSIAAAATQPASSGANTVSSTPTAGTGTSTSAAPTASTAGKHHRRLGSTGKTRRRLSDAREASARPLLGLAASTTPTGSAALSLATLSLSISPPSNGPGHSHSHSLGSSLGVPHVIGHGHAHSYSYSHGYSPLAPKPTPTPTPVTTSALSITIVSESAPNSVSVSSGKTEDDGVKTEGDKDEEKEGGSTSTPIPISGGKTKKRGVDYRCESCAKIYRHPNCLNKHRWEHTKQWREASKFVLSKHQQVQLLEAAAILSYMGKDPTSLPEDRSEWPSFLSGGSLPKTEPVTSGGASSTAAPTNGMPAYGSIGRGNSAAPVQRTTTTYALHPHPVSASVPNPSTLSASISNSSASGPRMHDYAIRGSGVARVAPGLIGVPTVPAASPSLSTNGHGHAIIGGEGAGGWSLPSSSVRSGSRSRSRSGSGSGSSEDVDIDIDVVGDEDTTRPKIVQPATSLGMAHSPGFGYAGSVYGYSYGSYAPASAQAQSYSGRRGGMKREEDEMSVGFSVREEDEEEEGADAEESWGTAKTRGGSVERKWDGMEMEVDMDMD